MSDESGDTQCDPVKGTETEPKTEDCYRYEGDVCIYTDPWTKKEYVLNSSKTDWVPREETDYEFDGKTYIHRDKKTGRKRRWNLDSKEWETSESELDSDSENEKPIVKKAMPGWNPDKNILKDSDTGVQTYKDPVDGTTYEWDSDKNAWFPKMDSEFMAVYQLNYGFTSDGQAKPTIPDAPTPEAPKPTPETKQKQTKKAEWFQVEKNKNAKVYVSGLPESITEEKFISMMSRFGVIESDVRNDNKPRIKIYRDLNGVPKGDALCSYVMVESVDLSIQILDDSLYEDGKSKIRVERATFEMKGEAYNPDLKPKKLRKKELENLKKQKDKKLAWDLDVARGMECRPKYHKVIVLFNLFSPSDFVEKPEKIIDLKVKIRNSCEKFGRVKRLEVYDQHVDGIGMISFNDPIEADLAIQMLNGRLFNGRVLKVIVWDGKTKYQNSETDDEQQKRYEAWKKFLDDGDEEEEEDKDNHPESLPEKNEK
uniref:HIV Tat-specific factor 1 homolog n=1 Tax=Lepeophtheirus salmonis TaxID=72036 RepID=C1BVH6_LEPSM|nr:HIV Tat-specific factor 1 homolog [Lepeophtheirus salmonis]